MARDAMFRMKSMFFNKPALMNALDKATLRVLSKFGAFVRTSAKSSIRKRKRMSRPGDPPSSHAGHLKRLIYFAYEPDRRSVVIGPVPFGAGEAPALLEQEHVPGTVRRVVRFDKKRGKQRVMTYRARPYMGPAMEREKPKLPAMWLNSIR